MGDEFERRFEALTGNPPFPWQISLYKRFISDRPDPIPASCNLPTGLGKTSVIAIWLLALATHPARMPRRLVYVVNRRTVVDQTTTEVENYREKLKQAEIPIDLAISTLRGQYADNRDWSADPSRPAVICGTVDMIGSRLLFSGYGIGFKGRPLHAGFLGQDVLLVHDEAHLEPAFQKLIESIKEEQGCKDFRPFEVMALTATPRGTDEVFELTPREKEPDEPIPNEATEPIHHVWKRLASKKALKFEPTKRDSVAATIGAIARTKWQGSGKRVLIFVRTIDDVKRVREELMKKGKGGLEELRAGIPEKQIQILTGTLRGLERDRMANPRRDDGCPIFARFLPRPAPDASEAEQWKVTPREGTVYLICTSAGEVGVDISADHMVCDLSTLDSMAQRFGRVNRRGDGDAEVDVVYEIDPDPKKKDNDFEKARWFTKSVLERLPEVKGRRSVSPRSLMSLDLDEHDRAAAFAPTPTILPATDILFDAWALTTITGKLPGRPPVEPYLHGLPTDWQPEETQVAWREEVAEIIGDLTERYEPRKLLDEYPLRPQELLREPSYRAFECFTAMAKRLADRTVPVWLVDEDGAVAVLTLAELADKQEKKRINWKTVLLPPSAGGLNGGMLDGTAATANDVSETADRRRVWNDEADPNDMRKVVTIDWPGDPADEDSTGKQWRWFERSNEGGKSAKFPIEWNVHVADVERHAAAIVDRLPLSQSIRDAIKIAAKFHDHGKKRKLFQRILGNSNPTLLLAKSGKKGGRVDERYRHEFGSLIDIKNEEEFAALTDELKDLVLHLIASHHGRARPHFPADEAFDPNAHATECEKIAREVPRRFARLQRQYGRWGLAYLESLLRAADWAASGKPSAYLTKEDSR